MTNCLMVSVIIPVYNGQDYIGHCLRSALSQTYHNIEIIVVDDGSNDNTGEICDRIAAADERVKVIHQENGGVNSARRKGVDNASGDWLVFLDADDTLPEKAVETIAQSFDSGAGIIVRGDCTKLISRDIYLKDLLSGKIGPELWAKAFSAELFKSNCPVLDRSIPMGEDLLINLSVGAGAKSIQVVAEPLYNLNSGNPQSVTRTFRRTWEYEKYYFKTFRELFLEKCKTLDCFDELEFLTGKSQLNGIKYIMLDGNKVDYSDEEFRRLESYFADRTDKLGLSEKLIFKVKNDKVYRLIMKTYMRLLKHRKQ